MARSRLGYRLVEVLLESYRKENRPGKAWRVLIEHITALEDSDLTFKLAHLQMVSGMVDQSVDLFQEMFDRRILRGSAIEAPLAANLIEALNRSERYQRAVSVYESLENVELSEEPTDCVHYNAGNSYLAVDRPEDARMLGVAMRPRWRCGKGTPVRAPLIVLSFCTIWANCHYVMQEDETAIAYYESALRQAVTPADMAYEECALGDAHFAQGRRDKALHYYRLAADHGDVEARRRLAGIAGEL